MGQWISRLAFKRAGGSQKDQIRIPKMRKNLLPGHQQIGALSLSDIHSATRDFINSHYTKSRKPYSRKSRF